MKFMRRPDLSKVPRVEIAVQAFQGLGVYGEITRIANCYQVSRQFVYSLLWQLRLLFELEVSAAVAPAALTKEVDRHILLLRLEGHCALESIAQIIKQLGLPYASVGYISQRLTAYARALPEVALAGAQMVFLLCDEIFTLGQPILITVEPRSLAILKIELADQRDAAIWQKHWEALVTAGVITKPKVVADQGSGLVKGCELMGLSHHPDLFHLLHPLAPFAGRFERQALGAIENEYERARVFESAKSASVIGTRMESYEAAQAVAQAAIERYDNYGYLWRELRKALELFDDQGRLTPLAQRQAEIGASLALRQELGDDQLRREVASFARGMEGYWDYYRSAEESYQELLRRYAPAVIALLCLGWQAQRQATNSKDYGRRRQLTQDAAVYLTEAERLAPEQFQTIQREVMEVFESEVRSSSLVENINSGLQQLLVTCRGQVTQELLELFAYVHNHRRFVRGKRAGQAPIEILTGKPLEQDWLESLLETA